MLMFGSGTGIWRSLPAVVRLTRAGLAVARRWADADPRPE